MEGRGADRAVRDRDRAGSVGCWGARPRGDAQRVGHATHRDGPDLSFRAARDAGPALHNIYRVTALGPGHAGCQAGVVAQAPPSKAGSTVRVVLSPTRTAHWCSGTFRGQVWDVITGLCPVGKACPASITPPLMIGKFGFRVARG